MAERTALDYLKEALAGKVYRLKGTKDIFTITGTDSCYYKENERLLQYPILVTNLTAESERGHIYHSQNQHAFFDVLESLIQVNPRDLTRGEAEVLAYLELEQARAKELSFRELLKSCCEVSRKSSS